MKILFLAQRVPYPPNKGDKLRSFNIIKFLSRRHDISLVCLADYEEELQHREDLAQYCRSIDIVPRSSLQSNIRSLLALFSSVPLTLPYFYSPQLKQIVQRKLHGESFDLIFVYCSSMAQYVEDVRNVPRVIDFVDVDSEKWAQYAQRSSFPKNWVYRSESTRLRKYEQQIADTYQHCFLVSEREVEDFRKAVHPCPNLTAIVNGVDQEMFSPSSEPYDPNSLVFTGDMGYFANVETVVYFCDEILPHIKQTVPEVTFTIVGRNPTEELVQLGEQHSHIIVTGSVESIQPYLRKAAAVVTPMRIARGIQNKILEAMSAGIPVVTSSLGFEGISATPGQDIFVEDQPESFAKRVVELMADSELRKTMALNARKRIEEHYNWNTNIESLEHILLTVVDQAR